MSGNDSFAYCDSDEEVFIGKVTEKELLKRALTGLNYDSDSPFEKSTPRNKALNESGNLPDVLPVSTSKLVTNSISGHEVEGAKQGPCPSLNSSLNEDIIDLDSKINSVQIISDDESFLLNEKLFEENGGNSNIDLNKDLDNLNISPTKEVLGCDDIANVETNAESTCLSSSNDANCDMTCESFLDGEKNTQLKDSAKEEDVDDSNKLAKTNIFQDTYALEEPVDNTVNIDSNHISQTSLLECSEHKTLPEKSVNNSINSDQIKAHSESTEVNRLVPTSLDLSMNSLPSLEVAGCPSALQEKCLNSKGFSLALNDGENISIDGISDSILNISRVSSNPSPGVPMTDKVTTSNNLFADVMYEDISFDEKQQFVHENKSYCIASMSSVQSDDLHMSVDEPDYQQTLTIADPQESQLSFFKSFDKSSTSSYHTADTKSENATSKPSSDSFKSYREGMNDSVYTEGTDVVTRLDNDNEDEKETSFEIVVQNRQNSFISSSPLLGGNKIVNETAQTKPKVISKLPVYNHISKSLLQPPKLHFTSGHLKSNSSKWAKKLQTIDSKISKLNTETVEVKKDVKCKLPTPYKLKATPQSQQKQDTGSSKKDGTYSSNIPSINKTPAKVTSHYPSRLAKSESKTPQVSSTNSKIAMSTERRMKSKLASPFVLQDKKRYKNIVSPVQAYIRGSPPVLQERKGVTEEIKLVVHSENKITNSHLPIKLRTESATTNVAKKLDYEKVVGQENLDPNYTRDTLPPRSLQNSAAVFLKEPEPPKKYLPKMGQKLQKLLDTPRPKLVVHQGRVKDSPNTKGILTPRADVKSSENYLDLPAERVSIRVVKTADNTNELK